MILVFAILLRSVKIVTAQCIFHSLNRILYLSLAHWMQIYLSRQKGKCGVSSIQSLLFVFFCPFFVFSFLRCPPSLLLSLSLSLSLQLIASPSPFPPPSRVKSHAARDHRKPHGAPAPVPALPVARELDVEGVHPAALGALPGGGLAPEQRASGGGGEGVHQLGRVLLVVDFDCFGEKVREGKKGERG